MSGLEREAPRGDDNPYALPDDKRDDDFILEPIEPIRRGPKIGRNQWCSCGSGKKYKKRCGR